MLRDIYPGRGRKKRWIRSEIPIKSIIYFSGNNEIREGPKQQASDWDPDPNLGSKLWPVAYIYM